MHMKNQSDSLVWLSSYNHSKKNVLNIIIMYQKKTNFKLTMHPLGKLWLLKLKKKAATVIEKR
ncbi:hypothetical protein BpHYR1_036959 [Brachionus plicatilis]|uniref:Uncharacterized protein n=1 Tax=Brachionus plicatilis TaxID=10195 RepID=A0A3M7S9N6_BRAPC|nr:hypothetical protein BpHYR1_036959 [Brachionus plicatilis]